MPSSSAVGLLVDGRYRIVEPIAAGGMGSSGCSKQGVDSNAVVTTSSATDGDRCPSD